MKKIFLFITIFLATSCYLSAQCGTRSCPGFNSLNIGTGIDQNGNFIPLGSVDPFWQLMNNPAQGQTGCNMNPVNTPNAIAIPLRQNATNWLNVNNCPTTAPCGAISSHSGNVNSCGTNGTPWRFRKIFCVCKKTRVNARGNIRIDDSGRFRIYGPNNTLLYDVPLNLFNGHSINQSISSTSPIALTPGQHYIEVELDNGNIGGRRNFMGFAINGTLTTANGQNAFTSTNIRCCPATPIPTPNPNPKPDSLRICCPPISKNLLAAQFSQNFLSGSSGPFTMELSPTTQFEDMMQAYANLIETTCPSNTLFLFWQLCDLGRGTELLKSCRCVKGIDKSTSRFEANGNGILPTPNFFQTSCQPNRWYRITLRLSGGKGSDCFDEECKFCFDFRWIESPNGRPRLEIR